MHYQSDGTQVPVRPTPGAVIGTPGYVTGGNPATGLAASNDDPDLMNMILGELGAFLTAAGIAPDKTNNAQVLASIRAMFPARTEIISGVSNNGYLKLPGYIGGGRPKIVWGGGSIAPNNLTAATLDVVFADAFSLACFTVKGSCYTPSYTYGGSDSVWASFSASLITTAGFRAVVDNLNFATGTPPTINRNVGFTFVAIGADTP